MILADVDIHEFLRLGALEITPLYNEDVQIQPASVDLRLGSRFRVFRNLNIPYIDPKRQVPDLTEEIELARNEPFILHPGEFVLGSTVERVKLPDNLAGRVEGRSSFGRLGVIVHSTAGFIDPGFNGHITLEMTNIGRHPIALEVGTRICQIVFQILSHAAARPYGLERNSKYSGQVGPTPSRSYRDDDAGDP